MSKGFEVSPRAIHDTADQPPAHDQPASTPSDQFEVPFQAIHQLGDAAGDTSSATELIRDNSPSGEDPAKQEGVNSLDAWSQQSVSRAIMRWDEATPPSSHVGRLHRIYGSPVPESIDAFLESQPGAAKKISRLCAVRQAFNSSGIRAINGERLGDTMELVLVPWKFFANETYLRIGDLPSLYYTLVEIHGPGETTTEAVANLGTRYIVDGSTIEPVAYLHERVTTEGDWGVRLMQVSSQPGLDSSEPSERSLSSVTLLESRQLAVGNSLVGKLGIFEAIALQFQEPDLTIDDSIWWPANVFTDVSIESPNHKPKLPLLTTTVRRLKGPERRQVRLVVEP